MAELDPNAPIACELDDDDVFLERRAQRATLIAGMPVTDNAERSLARQKRNLNNLMDKTEKLLRTFSRYEVDQGQGNPNRRFTENNKAARLKELRMIWIELKAQDDFVQVACDHGWHIAEKMKNIEGNGQISDTRKKILADLLREEKKAPSVGKNRNPNKFSPYPPQRFNAPVPWQANPGAFSGAYAGVPMQGGPMQRPMYAPGQFPPAYPGNYPSLNMPYAPRLPTSKFVKKVDKSKSSCYSCNGVGHWAGDPACPFMQVPGQQPTPPGEG